MTVEPAASSASVATDRPGRFAKQLVAHLGRRGVADWDAGSGHGLVDFGQPLGRVSLVAQENVLRLTVTGSNLDMLEDAVGRHLVRFGAKDELHVSWVRSDGTAGTEQRNTGDAHPAAG